MPLVSSVWPLIAPLKNVACERSGRIRLASPPAWLLRLLRAGKCGKHWETRSPRLTTGICRGLLDTGSLTLKITQRWPILQGFQSLGGRKRPEVHWVKPDYGKIGAGRDGQIRTADLSLRRRPLYPSELRPRKCKSSSGRPQKENRFLASPRAPRYSRGG